MSPALPPATVRQLCSDALFAVVLQCQRLRHCDAANAAHAYYWRIDLLLLLTSLCRFRQLVDQALETLRSPNALRLALLEFDRCLPTLREFQAVLTHHDRQAFAHSSATGHLLYDGQWDGHVFRWHEAELSINAIPKAAQDLLVALLADIERQPAY